MIIRLILILTISFVTFVESARDNNTFFPNLPVGEYQITVKRIKTCDPTRDYKIRINWDMNKISNTKTVIDGNLTLQVPLDDELNFLIHFDQKTANGGWTNNTIVMKKKKMCSMLLSLIKEEWYVPFGWPPDRPCVCPFPAGIYYTRGLPAHNYETILRNTPKFFVYGSYRLRIRAVNKDNDDISCTIFIWDMKRPWELP